MTTVTRETLRRQLDRAIEIGDRAAEIMLRARLDTTPCPACGSKLHLLCNRESPLSELEERYLHGDR